MLTGELPEFLPPTLNRAGFWNNLLTGQIPSSYVNHSSLEHLILGGNQLTGELPVGISTMNLVWLDVSLNSLGGQLPRDWSTIPSMDILRVNNNMFTGELPEFLPSTLTDANLSDNLLTGEIPSSYVTLSSLDRLLISGNNITGTVSTGMCELGLSIFEVDCSIVECSCCNCTRRLLEARTINRPTSVGKLRRMGAQMPSHPLRGGLRGPKDVAQEHDTVTKWTEAKAEQ
eukprot:CAMPEP_0116551310 /NCGR_PEP_ID=MMETSP0397-20121206/5892_1 /TAXON_ID=216820 /ORGANISM="Cyclophora tenuis, Strain ECT3854" /LENGTH=229 /DNA_ID=CAMNT_0004076199 /DNA_START=135 /DNA_END=824 /DNA_ORIENTATION=+